MPVSIQEELTSNQAAFFWHFFAVRSNDFKENSKLKEIFEIGSLSYDRN